MLIGLTCFTETRGFPSFPPSVSFLSYLFLHSTASPTIWTVREGERHKHPNNIRDGTHSVDVSPSGFRTVSRYLSGAPLEHLMGLLAQVTLAPAPAWQVVCTTSLAYRPHQSDPPGFRLGPLLPEAARHSDTPLVPKMLRLSTVPA